MFALLGSTLADGSPMFCVSDLLQKPVEDLLMNQANRFRETQEQRELISRGLPALYNGHVTINTLDITLPGTCHVPCGHSVPFQGHSLDKCIQTFFLPLCGFRVPVWAVSSGALRSDMGTN